MLDGVKDKHLPAILAAAKKPGLAPFFRNPRAMIALREHAARRGVYWSQSEALEVQRAVFAGLEDGHARNA
jgi:hypothetical protein